MMNSDDHVNEMERYAVAEDCVAVIPARGGSKRIPRKNIKEFCGKPIIAYSIETALQSGLFKNVIVSTDDQEIADVALHYGAKVPFMRPKELSDDYATTGQVIMQALKELKRAGHSYDLVFCIYATSPFLRVMDLQKGYDLLTVRKVPAAYTVSESPFPVYRAQCINDKGELEMLWPEYKMVRSQDLPKAYQDAGQFYCAQTKLFMKNQHFSMIGAWPIILPRRLVHDIDTEEDWTISEFFFKASVMNS